MNKASNFQTKLVKIISLFAVFIPLVLGAGFVHAQEGPAATFQLSLEIIPESAPVGEGFVNSSSTGFRAYAEPGDGTVFHKIAIFVDDALTPLDERIYDASAKGYYLSSNTSDFASLSALLPEGGHKIRFEYQDSESEEYELYQEFLITSDFTAPGGTLDITTTGDKDNLKLGDEVSFLFTPSPSSADIDRVFFDFNGVECEATRLSSGTYIYKYIVRAGDSYDGSGNVMAKVSDLAQNRLELSKPAGFTLDGIAPKVSIISPKDSVKYAQRNLKVEYEISGDFVADSVKMYLDGVAINSSELANLADGVHRLKITATDLAGNMGEAEISFEIDNSPPGYVSAKLDGAGPFISGSEITLEGQTEPYARVTLEIHSGIYRLQTTADSTGKFCFKIKTSDLEVGVHRYYLIFSDELSNTATYEIGEFEVTAPVKIAQADLEVKSDVEPPLIASHYRSAVASSQITRSELGEVPLANKSGTISTASTERDSGGWSLYILLGGLIIIVAAILTAGYYGYELLFVANGQRTTQPLEQGQDESIIKYQKHLPEDNASKGAITKDASEGERSDESGKDQNQVRW